LNFILTYDFLVYFWVLLAQYNFAFWFIIASILLATNSFGCK